MDAFTVELELAGWDDKWIYHLHRFQQDGESKAVGVTRALIWKRGVPTVLHDPCLGVVGAPDESHRKVRHAVQQADTGD